MKFKVGDNVCDLIGLGLTGIVIEVYETGRCIIDFGLPYKVVAHPDYIRLISDNGALK